MGSRARSGQRRPGLVWLIDLLVIPLLIAVIGHAALAPGRSGNASAGALATVGPPGKRGTPKLNLAPMSIVRSATT
ncbi:hypothetical protein [Mycobacterium shigaense]|uniref:hypothetical protein n=1 Tax=Mycobacterium shigaense TaxID=722731 RepID=UPI002ADF80B7|nr:hypothetical protein [Mycobacterium shigaense]MEA1120647.1 hypothetical protein [Mycobacterium shigaense]